MYHICPALARIFPKEAKKIRFCLFVPVFDLPVPAEEAGKEIDIQPHNYAEQRGENAFSLLYIAAMLFVNPFSRLDRVCIIIL